MKATNGVPAMTSTTTLLVNARRHLVTTDPRRPLLQVLREELHLTGPKLGCGEGQCGACNVLIDGKLHPVQEASIAETAMQCGFWFAARLAPTEAPARTTP